MDFVKWNRVRRKPAPFQIQRVASRSPTFRKWKKAIRLEMPGNQPDLLDKKPAGPYDPIDSPDNDPVLNTLNERDDRFNRGEVPPDSVADLEHALSDLRIHYEILMDQFNQEHAVRIEELEEKVRELHRKMRQMAVDHEKAVGATCAWYENRIDLVHMQYDTEFEKREARIAREIKRHAEFEFQLHEGIRRLSEEKQQLFARLSILEARIQSLRTEQEEREKELRSELWLAHVAKGQERKEFETDLMHLNRRYEEKVARLNDLYGKLQSRYEDEVQERRNLERKLQRQVDLLDRGDMRERKDAAYERPLPVQPESWSEMEKRRARRFPVELNAILESPESVQPRKIHNISNGGCFISLARALEPETPLRFRLFLDFEEGTGEIRVNGKVTFSVDEEQAHRLGGRTGVGVEMTDFPSAADERKFLYLMSQVEGAG